MPRAGGPDVGAVETFQKTGSRQAIVTEAGSLRWLAAVNGAAVARLRSVSTTSLTDPGAANGAQSVVLSDIGLSHAEPRHLLRAVLIRLGDSSKTMKHTSHEGPEPAPRTDLHPADLGVGIWGSWMGNAYFGRGAYCASGSHP